MFVRHLGRLVQVDTPAKLNLFLEVLARRADGFHEIETLIVAITLFDTLSFEASPSDELRLECRWADGWRAWQRAEQLDALGGLPADPDDNLVLKALRRLRERSGVQQGGALELVKRIPSAAGLGGASSDAAAALVAANQGWRLGWSVEQLALVAAELGSDVPFFLATGQFGPGAAVCRGRGEQIEPLKIRKPLHFVVVRPPEGLSTPQVYRRCQPAAAPVPVQPLVAALAGGSLAAIGRRMVNRLQEPAAQLCVWIGRLERLTSRLGCWGHQMSGSGSSYFALCRHARHAQTVAQRLRAASVGAVFCTSTVATASTHHLRLSH